MKLTNELTYAVEYNFASFWLVIVFLPDSAGGFFHLDSIANVDTEEEAIECAVANDPRVAGFKLAAVNVLGDVMLVYERITRFFGDSGIPEVLLEEHQNLVENFLDYVDALAE